MHRISIARRDVVSAYQDDATQVELARRDPRAFGDLYRRYVVRVYRYLFSHVGDSVEAEDLTSQVFVSAWQGLSRYREQGSFAAWLFGIARHKIGDHFRHRRNHLSINELGDSLWESTDFLGHIEGEQELESLARLVARLKPEQRELLRLRFAADMSYQQIGALLGKSEAAVKMSAHRIIRRLQEDWEQDDD